MTEKIFNPKKLQILNDPQRLKEIRPAYIWDKLSIEKSEVLVEIGAGTAFFCVAFLRLAAPSKIYACDVSEVMIDWMTKNVVPEFPDIVPVKTGQNTIPLGDAIADLVFTINLHHELDDPARTLDEAYRLLRPGGNIFIVDWKKKDMAEGPPTEIRCLPEEIRAQLENSGFEHVRLHSELPKHFLLVGEKDHCAS